ncbi:MAG: cytochrome d ubiquinol oxidase subunit II [Pseudomonadota bacterium]
MDLFGDPAVWLPVTFAALMGTAILIYVVLDGFDLGIGVLFAVAEPEDRDPMVASIGPFWDANETWLVLAVGLLLVAFPVAHGTILTALYLPVFVMLIGLTLRGVAFEFRAKAPAGRKAIWELAFFWGSLSTSLAQGFMLGLYIIGLQWTWPAVAFATLTALCLTLGYVFNGATWLIYKTEGDLQRRSYRWARFGLAGAALGVALVSLVSPLVSPRIFEKWFSVPELFLLAPLPIGAALLIGLLWLALKEGPSATDRWCWLPFLGSTALITLAFVGLAYSFYPYVVPEQLTIYEAAAAPESLFIILIGTAFVLPVIALYSVLAYTVFRGKSSELRYD